MPVPATTGTLRSKLSDMQIGDYIPMTFATAFFGVPTPLPNQYFFALGDDTKSEMPINGLNGTMTDTGKFYLIKVAKGLLISDRVIAYNVSWDKCNTYKVIEGIPWYGGNVIPKMTSNTSPSGVASASSEISPNASAYKAFDNSNTSAWATKYSEKTGWLCYEFDTPKIIRAYSITAKTDVYSKTAPSSWTFEAFDENTGQWIVLHSMQSVTGWTAGLERTYIFTNNKAFKKYRINIFSIEDPSLPNVGLAELKMMETAGIIRSLTGGVAYADANGNKSMTNLGYGAFPVNNEFDKYIVNFPQELIQNGKTIDDVFHCKRDATNNIPYTWCQDTPINGILNVNSVAGDSSRRVCRVVWNTSTHSHLPSNDNGSYVGFRPVFEYIE